MRPFVASLLRVTNWVVVFETAGFDDGEEVPTEFGFGEFEEVLALPVEVA